MKIKIKKLLNSQGNYEDVDEINIKLLLENISVAEDTFKEMGGKYTIDSINAAGSSTKVHPLWNVYNAALKNIKELCTKLGITPQERIKLNIVKEEKDLIKENFHN